MATKREKGKGYNCFEKFSREHLKVCPMKDIYLLPMDDDATMEDPDNINPRISHNAITVISPITTMRLRVYINTDNITVLVDSGTKPKQHCLGVDQGWASSLAQDPCPDQLLAPPSEKPRARHVSSSSGRSGPHRSLGLGSPCGRCPHTRSLL
jgi:hypothetical protein